MQTLLEGVLAREAHARGALLGLSASHTRGHVNQHGWLTEVVLAEQREVDLSSSGCRASLYLAGEFRRPLAAQTGER